MRTWPILFLLSACSTPQMGTSPGTQLVDNTALPMPSRSDVVAASRPYLIGPFDKLNIDVFGVEELARAVQIDQRDWLARRDACDNAACVADQYAERMTAIANSN